MLISSCKNSGETDNIMSHKIQVKLLKYKIIGSVFGTYAQYYFSSYNFEICDQVFIFYCFIDHYTWNKF